MTKKAKIKQEISIPEGVTASYKDNEFHIKGEKGELTRKFAHPDFSFSISDGTISIKSVKSRREQKALMSTFAKHIRNMIHGVTEGFEYTMKTVYSHFPINVSADDRGVVIENFIGEEKPRIANVVGSTEVDVQGDEIVLTGPDKEEVGQTAANIEQTTRAQGRDPRVFQDGIYVVEKV